MIAFAGDQLARPTYPLSRYRLTCGCLAGRLVVLAGRSVTGGEGAGPERIVVPLMALGLDSMALAQLKGG